MSRTANDFKTFGTFLPNFDMADPAPTVATVQAPEDDHPWTKEEDQQLKKVIARFLLLPDDEKPWPMIAIKCNAGHNSGSCKARWIMLSKQTAKYDNVKSIQFGAKGGPIVGKVGMFNTNVAISS